MIIKGFFLKMRYALAILPMLLIAPATQAATTPSLGAAASYAVLSNTYTNPAGATTVNGDIGFTVAPAFVPMGVHTNYGSGSPYATAGADQATALAALNAQPCTFTWAAAVELGSDATHGTAGVFTPGVYCAGGAMALTTSITLNGSGTYIFRSVGAFSSAASVNVTLAGGASANDVFWTPTGATTFGASASIVGNIIATSPITFGASTALNGRALAYSSTVTNGDANTITAPAVPAPVTGILHVITQVVNNSGGAATTGSFTAHVKLSGADVAASPAAGVGAPGRSYSLPSGMYVVSQDASAGYGVTFSGDCDSSGTVTLGAGGNKTCTITNDDAAQSGSIDVSRVIINDNGGTKTAADFSLSVNGTAVASGATTVFPAPATYTVSGTTDAQYTQAFSGDCSASGNVSLASGNNKFCVIVYNDIAQGTPPATGGTINVTRLVVNDNGGTRTAANFESFVNGTAVLSDSTNAFPAPSATVGTAYTITGTSDSQYTITFYGDCDASGRLSLFAGSSKFCILLYNDTGSVAPSPSPSSVPYPFPAPIVDPTLLQNLQNRGIAVHALVKLADDGNLNTQSDSAVYYVAADGKRHAFPNSRIYSSWYTDFNGVRVITSQELASLPLGPNVRYKPGNRMVKFTTDPKVYAVSRGGVLRWVKTEGAATALYGGLWNKSIDDISDAFYGDYTFGADVSSSSDFNVSSQASSVGTISADYGL